MTYSIAPKSFSMISIIINYLSWKPYSSKNCNHPSVTRALVFTEHFNFSHSLPLQLLYFLSPPVFTHIATTTYISNTIMLTVLITMRTVLIIVLTVPTKICTIIFPGPAPQLLIIYVLTFQEITPTFTSPEDDLRRRNVD